MKALVCTLLFLFLATAARAQQCDSECATLRQIVADAGSAFRNVAADQIKLGDKPCTVKRGAYAARYFCTIVSAERPRSAAEQEAAARAAYEKLLSRLRVALPSMWKIQEFRDIKDEQTHPHFYGRDVLASDASGRFGVWASLNISGLISESKVRFLWRRPEGPTPGKTPATQFAAPCASDFCRAFRSVFALRLSGFKAIRGALRPSVIKISDLQYWSVTTLLPGAERCQLDDHGDYECDLPVPDARANGALAAMRNELKNALPQGWKEDASDPEIITYGPADDPEAVMLSLLADLAHANTKDLKIGIFYPGESGQ
jgi:hypothetical protein